MWFTRMHLRERGAASVEYAILIASIAAVFITAVVVLSPQVVNMFERGAEWTNPEGP